MVTYKRTTGALKQHRSHGCAAFGAESRHSEGSTSTKRAFGAGNRSVRALSESQLLRKRINDRDAQRANRQRTKEHIETLEKTVSDLRGFQESGERTVAVTQQQNRDLEDKIAFLRSKIYTNGDSSEAPLTYGVHVTDSSGSEYIQDNRFHQ
ncbi:hypothetical protein LTR49_028777 [Elasticomyces elasticus]|nr:hypothetical protein LTR49_028777 [Elasticomyces elasticus]